MKKDNLKKFISENKEEFDFGMPSEKTWSKIESGLKPKRKQKWVIPTIAASVSLILISIFLLPPKDIRQEDTPLLVSNEPKDIITNELAEVEEYYAVQVDLKVNEAEKFEESKELLKDVELLKKEFNVLKTEMGEGANSQELLEAMIQNYKLRLGLLEHLLEELNEEDNRKNYEQSI